MRKGKRLMMPEGHCPACHERMTWLFTKKSVFWGDTLSLYRCEPCQIEVPWWRNSFRVRKGECEVQPL